MYKTMFKEGFLEDTRKIKDKKSQENLKKKIEEIATILEFSPNHFKPLKKPLQGYSRVHVNDSFVLIFKVYHEKKTVDFVRYAHHDEAY